MEQFSTTELVFLVTLLALSAVGWLWAARRKLAGRPLLPPTACSPVPWGLVDLVLAFSIIFGSSAVLAGLLMTILGVSAPPTRVDPPAHFQAAIFLAGSITMLLATVVAVVLIWSKNGARSGDFGLQKLALSDLRIALVAFALLAGPVFAIQAVLVQWWPSHHPLVELMRQQPRLWFLTISVLTAVVVAPVTEELFFRVLLQGWLEKAASFRGGATELLAGCTRAAHSSEHAASADEAAQPEPVEATLVAERSISSAISRPAPAGAASGPSTESQQTRLPVWPIVASAALFALMHLSHGPDPIPLFVFALGLGYLYQRTRRLAPCVLVHAMLNSCSVALLLLDLYVPGS